MLIITLLQLKPPIILHLLPVILHLPLLILPLQVLSCTSNRAERTLQVGQHTHHHLHQREQHHLPHGDQLLGHLHPHLVVATAQHPALQELHLSLLLEVHPEAHPDHLLELHLALQVQVMEALHHIRHHALQDGEQCMTLHQDSGLISSLYH